MPPPTSRPCPRCIRSGSRPSRRTGTPPAKRIDPGSVCSTGQANLGDILAGLDVPDGDALTVHSEALDVISGDVGPALGIVQARAAVSLELQGGWRSLSRHLVQWASATIEATRLVPWNDY